MGLLLVQRHNLSLIGTILLSFAVPHKVLSSPLNEEQSAVLLNGFMDAVKN
jgi:hypothetical protein